MAGAERNEGGDQTYRDSTPCERSPNMKKLMFISFALALVMSLLALAQEATKPGEMKQEPMKAEKASAKAVSLSGKVSADGKTFVDKDNKSWTVSNPEALKGHEGHEVTLKAHEDAAKNEIHVVSVKMGKGEMKESTKKGRLMRWYVAATAYERESKTKAQTWAVPESPEHL